MRGRFLHPISVPIHLADGGKRVKGVTTVVKLTVLYMKSSAVTRLAKMWCGLLLAMLKITRLSSPLPARSPRCAPAEGGPR